MKNINNFILEKLVINKNIKNQFHNIYYALLGVYGGYDYLVDNLGDAMITGDNGSGPNIFIVKYNILITLDKKYFEFGTDIINGTISIWNVPEKYQDNINKFKKDYEDGKINLDDDCKEFDNGEYDKILKNFK